MTAEGERLRNEGMARAAARPSDAPWRAVAEATMLQLARSGSAFTVEDLVAEVGKPSSENAIGALFGGWSRRGMIVRTGYTKTSHALGHARTIATWRGTAKAAAPPRPPVRRERPRSAPVGTSIGPARPCPACRADHPVGTTCNGGWAPW